MKITFALLAFLVTFFFSPQSQADEAQVGQVERVESRGLFVPIYAVWNKAAVASVVLYSGGGDPAKHCITTALSEWKKRLST